MEKGFLFAIDARSKKRIGADHELANDDIIKIVFNKNVNITR
jgi:hypothetical protein